jgi:hypothetical protein
MFLARAGRRAALLLLLGLLSAVLVGCSGGGDDAAPTSGAKAPEGSTLDLVAGDVRVEATGNPGVLADTDKNAIVNTVRRYVIAATIDPMHGRPIGDLAPLFTAPAVAALAGLDRVAALDEGIPKATSTVKVTSAPMLLTALSDPTGAINMVGTSLYLDARTTAEDGPVRVKRSGELILTRDSGTWKIASFQLSADRTGSGLGRATTSTTGSTKP